MLCECCVFRQIVFNCFAVILWSMVASLCGLLVSRVRALVAVSLSASVSTCVCHCITFNLCHKLILMLLKNDCFWCSMDESWKAGR